MSFHRFALAAGFAALSFGAVASTPDLPSCDVWRLACHWTNSSRETSYNINRVVIHKTQGGTASGAASWFANCSSAGSAHFAFDKSNGYCYQCVYEADIAWHAGYSTTNSNSVGVEHSGWVANNDTSTACYNESGIETRSCRIYYAVPGNRSYVIGHSEVPGCSYSGGGTSCHSDPGRYWNWGYYMGQVNKGTVSSGSGSTKLVAGATGGQATDDKYGADHVYCSASQADLVSVVTATPQQKSGADAWKMLGQTSLSASSPTAAPSAPTKGYALVAEITARKS